MVIFENPLPYDIKITGSANRGFILTAGCCTCVFTDKQTMLKTIEDYIDDPKKMEKEYNEAMRHARPQPVESGIGYGPGHIHNNTLAVPMPDNVAEPCCQEDSPDEGCCSRR